MSAELTLPFGLSPGCEPYVDEFLLRCGIQKPDQPEEICAGGLVFPVGQKDDCKVCASTCQGCVEMSINLGYVEFDDVKHLIQNPHILNSKYLKLYHSLNNI